MNPPSKMSRWEKFTGKRSLWGHRFTGKNPPGGVNIIIGVLWMKKYFVKMFLACYDPAPAIKILPLGIAENFTWHRLGTIFGACWMFCCQFHRLCCRWPEVDWRTWSYFLAALNTCGTVWLAYQAADKTLASLGSRDLGSLLLLMSRSKELCFLLLLL